ncbi:uncharacterized protein K02A2.6-like [Momordica charantia]|uniref:Uncharacterized protein K02A2.6-like n=1 Tax=Momordica charantia TaxID=3673 RepID=A0A6J1CEB5_MOMCH|nr:uncharacterized protein K02A2.6-like [Momordica charantia]
MPRLSDRAYSQRAFVVSEVASQGCHTDPTDGSLEFEADLLRREFSVPTEELELVPLLSPEKQWGVDIIGHFPLGKGQTKFGVVAVDYFTKWAEAAALSHITESRVTSFVWTNIICRFGIPKAIVTDNGKQFDNTKFKDFCSKLGISHLSSSPAHPQANGQVEAVNKIIKRGIKLKLDSRKGRWVEELPEVLWSYRTTQKESTGETPFSLPFGSEVVVPVEIGMPSDRVDHYEATANGE